MKKLMIAAATAAMIGGAFAEECVTCDPYETSVEKNAAFYDVQFKIKTLTSKKVKCGDCEGYCMEQGNRTINGVLWDCEICDNVLPYQLVLWEKAGQIQYTSDLEYKTIAAGSTKESWKVTASYYVTGYCESGYDYDSQAAAEQAALVAGYPNDRGRVSSHVHEQIKYYNTIEWENTLAADTKSTNTADYDTAAEAASTAAANAVKPAAISGTEWTVKGSTPKQKNTGKWMYSFSLDNAKKTFVKDGFNSEALALAGATANEISKLYKNAVVTVISASAELVESIVTPDGTCYWQSESATGGNYLEWWRYSKKADKLEAFLQNGFTGANNEVFDVTAVGFGTYDTKKLCPKAINGYAVGKITPDPYCSDIGEVLDDCIEFNCGDDCWGSGLSQQATDAETFFMGTWSIKKNDGLKKKNFSQIVPSFYTVKVLCK